MEDSKIEWTDHTFNPWMGCQKVSPGCDHCYAEAMMDHRYGKVEWGPHGERKRTAEANWKMPLRWNNQARETGICGGESGSGARYMKRRWARNLRDECQQLGIAFFMKQMTSKKPIPSDLLVRQYPKTSSRSATMSAA